MLRPSSLALAGLAAAVLVWSSASAADSWVRVCSPHFEVLSDAGEAPAREAARRLERVRGVLFRLFPPRENIERPITLLVLESRARFSSLVPVDSGRGAGLAGFFQGGSERDYAVLHLSPDPLRPFEAAEHEYAHLVLNASLPAQPVWVAEGLADVLSDVVFDGREARLGYGRPEYEALLSEGSSLSLERLLAVGYDSPEYRGHAETKALYARSWALVRWVIHRQGLRGLRSFLDAVVQGAEPVVAFSERFGSLEEAEATLSDVPVAPLLRVPVDGQPDLPLEADVPTTADVEQRLGDLLLHGGRPKAAQRQFERALEADPDHVPTRNSFGGLLVRQGEWDAAREHLGAVLAAQPDDPAALLRDARLRLGKAHERGVALAPGDEEEIVVHLEMALSRAPHLYDAALLLAHLRPEPVEERIALLTPLFEQQPDRSEIGQMLSGLYLKRGDIAAARRVLERVRDAARDPAHRYLARRQLARLEAFSVVTAEVRGDLTFVACLPDGSLRFTIVADPRTVRLEAKSTRSFLVHGEEEAQAELLCGEQDRAVVVRYAPGGGTDPEVDGAVLWMAFDEP